ncbi:hypothetical protein [Paraburkholderia sp.]|jgi:hypothetical protein|uniref:hypothetical protein n=1 Tax=Paraburkholderia sp. TaxID=1926495 RepID=UPI002F410F29
MTIQNTLRPTSVPPVARPKPPALPTVNTAAPEMPPAEAPAPVAPGGLVGNHVNTTA